MKKVASGISPLIAINKKDAKTLYRQVYEGYRREIVGGNVRAGQRVPSTRVLALELGISRTPVSNAYAQLSAEGYFESRVGSGTIVSRSLSSGAAVPRRMNHPATMVSPTRRQLSKRCSILSSADQFYRRRGLGAFGVGESLRAFSVAGVEQPREATPEEHRRKSARLWGSHGTAGTPGSHRHISSNSARGALRSRADYDRLRLATRLGVGGSRIA